MSEHMIFCLGKGIAKSEGNGYQKSYRIFNTQLTPEQWQEAKDKLPEIKLLLADNYEKAWASWWQEASQDDKDKILNCEYFNADIFKEITGIDIGEGKEDETIEIEGKKYTVKEIKKALKLEEEKCQKKQRKSVVK